MKREALVRKINGFAVFGKSDGRNNQFYSAWPFKFVAQARHDENGVENGYIVPCEIRVKKSQ